MKAIGFLSKAWGTLVIALFAFNQCVDNRPNYLGVFGLLYLKLRIWASALSIRHLAFSGLELV